jgi:hypothetical protein
MVSRRQAIREGYLKSTALTVVERACTLLMQTTGAVQFLQPSGRCHWRPPDVRANAAAVGVTMATSRGEAEPDTQREGSQRRLQIDAVVRPDGALMHR